jgi:hypothetical protein
MIALDLTVTEMTIEYWVTKYSIAIFLFIPKYPHDPSPLYSYILEWMNL